MEKNCRKLLRRLLSILVRPLDLQIVTSRHKNACPSYGRLKKLPEIGTVIDVGVGDQGSPFLYSRFPNARFISIDPLTEAAMAVKRYLPSAENPFIQTALGAKDIASIKVEVSRKASRTSLLQRVQHDGMSQPVEERQITVRKLDSVMNELGYTLDAVSCTLDEPRHSIGTPILLKIDTEGYELECLRGAEQTLTIVSYVLLEAPLTLNFTNSYTFSEIVAFMAERQFEVFQILKAGNNNVDLLFCKSEDPLRRDWSYGNQKTI